MSRPVQVEQLYDDGTNPAITQHLFALVTYDADGAPLYECPCCSRLDRQPGTCAPCTAAGYEAMTLELGQ